VVCYIHYITHADPFGGLTVSKFRNPSIANFAGEVFVENAGKPYSIPADQLFGAVPIQGNA
jgi:hypothetical protein